MDQTAHCDSVDKDSSATEYGTDEVRSEQSCEAKKEKEVTVPWMVEGVEGVELDDEIRRFADFIGLDTHEKHARQQARSVVHQAASCYWPSSTVKVYGSHACGLSLPVSELDLIVESCGEYLHAHIPAFISFLSTLGVNTLTTLQGSTDAFVKITDPRSNLVINVTLNMSQSPVRYTVSCMKRVFSSQPGAGPVLLVVRTVLHQCSLMDVAQGGVSSYTLTLMMFHLLRTNYPQGQKIPPSTLLTDFLSFYSEEFDFKNVTINSEVGTPRLHGNDCVSAADLADPGANAAEGFTKLGLMKAMFSYLKLALGKWDDEEMAGCRGKSPLSTIIAHKQLWTRSGK